MLDGGRSLDGLFTKFVDECPDGWVVVADVCPDGQVVVADMCPDGWVVVADVCPDGRVVVADMCPDGWVVVADVCPDGQVVVADVCPDGRVVVADVCPDGWVVVADELRESSVPRFTQVVRPVLPEYGCVVHVPAARWEHRRNTANDKSWNASTCCMRTNRSRCSTDMGIVEVVQELFKSGWNSTAKIRHS